MASSLLMPCNITWIRLAGSGALTALFRLSSGRRATGRPSLFEWHDAQAATYRLAPRSLSTRLTRCERAMPALTTVSVSIWRCSAPATPAKYVASARISLSGDAPMPSCTTADMGPAATPCRAVAPVRRKAYSSSCVHGKGAVLALVKAGAYQ